MNKNILCTESFSWRDNCLNTIKMLSAFSVLFFHAKEHLIVDVPSVLSIIFGIIPGVPTFFFLSGFLIWISLGKSEGIFNFVKKRFFRIFPQLWATKLLGIIVILFTFKELTSYTKLAVYGITSGVLLLPGTPDFLSEYGSGTPNGVLWTIYITIQFYAIVYFMHKLFHGKKIRTLLLVVILSFAVAFASNYLNYVLPRFLYNAYNLLIFRYFWLFAIGIFVAETREKTIPFLRKHWFIFVGLAMVFYFFPQMDIRLRQYSAFFCVFQLLGLLGFAYRYPKINIKFDFSYGLYLYHMIVVNAMIELGFTGKIQYMLIAMLLSVLIAIASEKTIGKLSFQKKKA